MNGFQTTKSVLSTRTWRTDLDKFFNSFDLETSSMAASILWALWNSRNSLLCDGKHATVDEVLHSAMSIFYLVERV